MSLTFTGGTGLFDKLGKIGRFLYYGHATVGPEYAAIALALQGTYSSAHLTLIDGVPAMLDAEKAALWQTCQQTLIDMAEETLQRVVADDVALADPTDVTANITEVIRQMTAASATVKRSTVSASSAAGSSNYGNGTVVLSTTRPDGTGKELCFAETATLTCTIDSQTGGASVGSETFQYKGDAAVTSEFSELWPAGSGQTATVSVIDSLTQGTESAGNLLSNSSWETTTSATVFPGWTTAIGTVTSDATVYYRGTKSITFVGDAASTALLTGLYQPFGAASNTAGTTNTLKPLTAYAVIIRHKVNTAPAAGVLRVELVDGSNAITTDAAGTNNRLSVTLSGLTSSWSTSTVVFRTPRVLPTESRLYIHLSTALSTGTTLYIDDVAMVEMTQLYEGGPLISMFAGSTKFIVDDTFTLTVTNDRGGSTYGGDFQTMFDRFFDMRSKKLQLPSASSPTIANTLITST